MPTVELAFADQPGVVTVEVRKRSVKRRTDYNRMIRRWAAAQPDQREEEEEDRINRANFIFLASFSSIEASDSGLQVPHLAMSDAEFERAFSVYLALAEDDVTRWMDAVVALTRPTHDKTTAPPETLTDEDKRDPN